MKYAKTQHSERIAERQQTEEGGRASEEAMRTRASIRREGPCSALSWCPSACLCCVDESTTKARESGRETEDRIHEKRTSTHARICAPAANAISRRKRKEMGRTETMRIRSQTYCARFSKLSRCYTCQHARHLSCSRHLRAKGAKKTRKHEINQKKVSK